MAARLIGLLLGLLIAAAGYIIIRPLGDIGPVLPTVDLARFEGLRALIGWGALALGAVAVLANLMPGRSPAKAPASARKSTPYGAAAPITFADDPPPVAPPVKAAEPYTPPLAIPAAAPPPAAAAVTPAVVASPFASGPVVDFPAQETFGQLREALRDKVRAGAWADAGAILARLPRLALTHRDRMSAAQDLGDFQRAQGRSDEASEAYGQALSYARLLHEIDPADPIAASDLAGALINVGDMATDEGRLDAALGAYEESVALRRRAVGASGAKRSDRHALSIALERLADAREDRGHRVRALDLYRESAGLAGALAAEDPQRYGADLQGTRTRLAELEERLAT